MTTLSRIDRARAFAIERHGDQLYGKGLPYQWHLGKVAELADKLGYSELIQAAAWLHDTVEDTSTTITEISELFGDQVAEIVEAVTYTVDDKSSGIDKITKAKSNLGSHVVKFCDASVNYSASTLEDLPAGKSQRVVMMRYGSYLSQLQENLPTPDEVEAWLRKASGNDRQAHSTS
jgi:hypothetical protein